MTTKVNEQAEKLRDKVIQAEFDWGNDPTNNKLKKNYEMKMKLYIGFCVKNGLEYKL